jgi:hypothetical protein
MQQPQSHTAQDRDDRGLWLKWTGMLQEPLVIGEEAMRLDYKLAILKSGRYQFEIAHESGLSEGRLSRFIRGREQLRPEEEDRLRTVLGLATEAEEVVHAG